MVKKAGDLSIVLQGLDEADYGNSKCTIPFLTIRHI
jgi:hypothetical protein